MHVSEEALRSPEPFVEFIGARWLQSGEEGPQVLLQLRPQLCNKWAVAHGGVIMTLLDVVMARACRLADPQGRPALTMEMKSSFVRPGTGALRASGQCLHHGRTSAFAEARLLDASGQLLAFASGTFRFVTSRQDERS